MKTVFIEPMGMIKVGNTLPGNVRTEKNTGAVDIPFKSVFESAINNVKETDAQVSRDVLALATGETDDLHTLSIDITKAQLSLQFLVELRNKTMDAYNEIMRINL